MSSTSGLPFRFTNGLKGRITCAALANEYLITVTVEPSGAMAPAWGSARSLKLWPTAGGLVVLGPREVNGRSAYGIAPLFAAQRPQLILLALHSASKVRLCFEHHELEGVLDVREQKQLAATVMATLSH